MSKLVCDYAKTFAFALCASTTYAAGPVISRFELPSLKVELTNIRVQETLRLEGDGGDAGQRASIATVAGGQIIVSGAPPTAVATQVVRRQIKRALSMRLDLAGDQRALPELRVSMRDGQNREGFVSLRSKPSQRIPCIARISAMRTEQRFEQSWLVADVELIFDVAHAQELGAFTGQLKFEVEN